MRRQSTLKQPIFPHQLRPQTKTINSLNTPLTPDSIETRLSYFSSCSRKTPAPVPYPSDRPSTPSCLATDSTSPSGSSDDSVYETHSLESSRYQTPSEFRSEATDRPHEPPSHSSDSLIMTHPKTSTRVRARQKSRMRRRLKTSSHCEHHRPDVREKKSHPYGWVQGSKVKNSAAEESSDTQSNQIPRNAVFRKSIHVILDRNEELPTRFLSLPVSPITSRRWSSVLAGYSDEFVELHGRQKKCSSEMEELNFITAVRQKLTQRELSSSKVETPASVTLRRASGMSNHRRTSHLSTGINSSLNSFLVSRDENRVNRQTSIYLITSRDVEFITRLIRSSISPAQRYSTNSKFREIQEPSSESPFKSDYHNDSGKHPSLSKRGFHPRPSIAADVAITVADVTPARHVSFSNVASADHGLQRQNSVTKVFCRKSVHEIIWENGSLNDSSAIWKIPSPGEDTDSRDSPLPGCSQTFESAIQNIPDEIPQSMTTRSLLDDDLVSEEQSGDNLVFHWEFKEPTSAESEVIPAFNPSYSVPSPTTESDLRTRTNDLVPSKLGVVTSFPALTPRKSTGDWISPPPAIAAIMKPSVRAMYDIGIDVVGVTSHPLPTAPSTPMTPQFEMGEFNDRNPDTEDQRPNFKPRKSVIIRHPQDVARVGELSKQGHAVGVSSGLRRTSSTRLSRIRFESFYKNDDLEDRKPWKKPRKDSGYPLRRSNSATPEWFSRKVSLPCEESSHRRTSKSYEYLNYAATKGSKDAVEQTPSRSNSRDQERWNDREMALARSTLVLAAVDNAGIHDTSTYTQKKKTGDEIRKEVERTNSLVVDGNNCLRPRPTPNFGNWNDKRQPSVDWIG